MTAWATETPITATADQPVPSPAARRRTAALLFHDDPWQGVQYPAALLRDVDTYWRGWAAREGAIAPCGLAATAVAAYVLGRRDEGAEPPARLVPPTAADADAQDVRAFAAGFLLCLALVLLGLALVSLRAL